jgi:predicted O-methyltransferase YrrM
MSPMGAEQLWAGISGRWLRFANRRRFEAGPLRELPDAFVPAARFAYFRDWTADERRVARDVEQFRARIAEVAGTNVIESMGSPRSGTFSLDERGLARGATPTLAPVSRHARTGVRPRGGILLRRLVTGVSARRILELGTNTGFSGCYFLSADTRPGLVTVEGSGAMCAIARTNLSRFSSDVVVLHRLFDEAIRDLAAAGKRFDCVYIDGQHEEQAVLHYAARVAPLVNAGGIVIFDDLYWSTGMNRAWHEICRSPRYSLTIDFGLKGVAVSAASGKEPRHHVDLCELMGRPSIGRPDW